MFEIHETVEGVLVKGLIEIKQASSLISKRLIQNNLMIK
jgi:hypothetical protein